MRRRCHAYRDAAGSSFWLSVRRVTNRSSFVLLPARIYPGSAHPREHAVCAYCAARHTTAAAHHTTATRKQLARRHVRRAAPLPSVMHSRSCSRHPHHAPPPAASWHHRSRHAGGRHPRSGLPSPGAGRAGSGSSRARSRACISAFGWLSRTARALHACNGSSARECECTSLACTQTNAAPWHQPAAGSCVRRPMQSC